MRMALKFGNFFGFMENFKGSFDLKWNGSHLNKNKLTILPSSPFSETCFTSSAAVRKEKMVTPGSFLITFSFVRVLPLRAKSKKVERMIWGRRKPFRLPKIPQVKMAPNTKTIHATIDSNTEKSY